MVEDDVLQHAVKAVDVEEELHHVRRYEGVQHQDEVGELAKLVDDHHDVVHGA